MSFESWIFFFLDSGCYIRQILILCHCFDFTSIYEGGIADSVSKWVFRQNLAPERLKEILLKKEDKEEDDKLEQKAGDEVKEHEGKSQEGTDRTAGQNQEQCICWKEVEHFNSALPFYIK